MQKILTAQEMREVDRLTTARYAVPSILLMENAARSAAGVVIQKLNAEPGKKRFLILCGKGNNGGDGAALARILFDKGARIRIVLFGEIDETKGDARINFESAREIARKISVLNDETRFEFSDLRNAEELFELVDNEEFDCVVDALFGTGLSRAVEGQLKLVIQYINRLRNISRPPLIFSLDIPSGLNADSNEPIGENVRADLTVTFTTPKLANVFPPASRFNGELHITQIGSPPELIAEQPSQIFVAENSDSRGWLERTKFADDSYKGKRGHALLIAGSRKYTGAAVLCANSCVRSGVGLVTLATAASARDAIAARVAPEVMLESLSETSSGAISHAAVEELQPIINKADAILIGCGLTSEESSARDFVREIVSNRKSPIVVDADGLNSLAPFELKSSNKFPLILTPHDGELLRLLGTDEREVLHDRIGCVRDFARKHNVFIVLKGERALIAEPGGQVVINPTGNSGLGKGGNGDTFAGIITGFITQAAAMDVDIFETIVAAVYVSGLAGDIAEVKFGKQVMIASDVRDCLVEAIRQIELRDDADK